MRSDSSPGSGSNVCTFASPAALRSAATALTPAITFVRVLAPGGSASVSAAASLLLAAAAAIAASASACSSFSAGNPTPATDGEAEAESSTNPGGDGAVPRDGGDAGPTSVTITADGGQKFAIDTKEVTVAEFLAFKKNFNDSSVSVWAACKGKTSLGPKAGCQKTTDDHQPMTCVDWCDARAYCSSVGKRLCGKIGGGATPGASAINPGVDQWTRACGGSKGSKWPYGAQPDTTACNTAEAATNVPLSVGKLATCSGGEPGLFDMSGNVIEWQDSCTFNDAGTQCLLRGGSFKRNVGLSACDSLVSSLNSDAYDDCGFRCCRDL